MKIRIGLICLSAVPDDPRVRRQGDLFEERGWDVVAFGLPGARSPNPRWTYLPIDASPTGEVLADAQRWVGAPGIDAPLAESETNSPAGFAENASRCDSPGPVPDSSLNSHANSAPRHWPRARAFYQRSGPAGRLAVRAICYLYFRALYPFARRIYRLTNVFRVYVDPKHAAATYWTLNNRFALLLELARPHKVDIWLANDWTALPIAQALAAEQGVPYAYDTHELAVDEYAERLRWRLFQRPVIAAIERFGIAGSAVTSCVSQGIADRLQEVYRLKTKPLLIRNMPQYEANVARACGETIEVLYHGVVSPGRGLEACIESVALWRPEFRLTIRGPASEAYLASLSAVAARAGVSSRVVLAPPVPMIDLVKEASKFDIGLFALPGHSQQNVHVLPNKFFEYTMAGLALCVSDLPEMTALLRKHDLGKLIPDVSPASIAEAINGFERGAVERHKRSAIEAAKTLNWEAEAGRLFDAIEHAVKERRTASTAPI